MYLSNFVLKAVRKLISSIPSKFFIVVIFITFPRGCEGSSSFLKIYMTFSIISCALWNDKNKSMNQSLSKYCSNILAIKKLLMNLLSITTKQIPPPIFRRKSRCHSILRKVGTKNNQNLVFHTDKVDPRPDQFIETH